MTDLRQAAQQALEACEQRLPLKGQAAIIDELNNLRTALEQQQAEPVAWMYQHDETGRTAFIASWEHKDGWKPSSDRMKLIGPLYTAPPQQQAEPVAWDKPGASFNDWWDGDYDDAANPFKKDSAAYWAWAGWKAGQRQWVGLTDEDVNRESAMIAQKMKLAFHAGMYVAQQILKEKNSD